MSLTIPSHVARVALALGLLVDGWIILSMALASPLGVETPLPESAVPAAVEPEPIPLAQADAVPVSYSSDQADRGEERYKSQCAECHGDDLRGGLNGGPPLRGMAFEQKYADGAPASWMFEFMSGTMPPNAPGRFSPSAYADLMAYILKRNGFQSGAPLPSDVEALDNLIMQK
jgi:mono/diheme cytochrome c family protein